LQGLVDKLRVIDLGIVGNSAELGAALIKMSPSQLAEHGLALAVQYCYAFEKEHTHATGDTVMQNAVGPETDITPTPDLTLEDLARVDWGSPLVSSLLVDIDPSIPASADIPKPANRRAPWIPTAAAIDIFTRKLDVDDVQKLLEGIAI
jgi:hypothetical protein